MQNFTGRLRPGAILQKYQEPVWERGESNFILIDFLSILQAVCSRRVPHHSRRLPHKWTSAYNRRRMCLDISSMSCLCNSMHCLHIRCNRCHNLYSIQRPLLTLLCRLELQLCIEQNLHFYLKRYNRKFRRHWRCRALWCSRQSMHTNRTFNNRPPHNSSRCLSARTIKRHWEALVRAFLFINHHSKLCAVCSFGTSAICDSFVD